MCAAHNFVELFVPAQLFTTHSSSYHPLVLRHTCWVADLKTCSPIGAFRRIPEKKNRNRLDICSSKNPHGPDIFRTYMLLVVSSNEHHRHRHDTRFISYIRARLTAAGDARRYPAGGNVAPERAARQGARPASPEELAEAHELATATVSR